MYFKYILLLFLLAVAFIEMINASISIGKQNDSAQEQFKCSNGKYILGKNQCNGYQQCEDGSDEINCTSCTGRTFRCGDGKCILTEFVCDRHDDCEDGNDENNCTNHVCDRDQFRCQSGQCIYEGDRCDGSNDCSDGSDETNCHECSKSLSNSAKSDFKCVGNNKCISGLQQCDSVKDCPYGSDEDETICQNLKCAEGEIQCKAGLCVNRHYFCVGSDPCGEEHKTENINYNCTECEYDSFKCKTEDKCIHNSRLCDTLPDCEDRSDESESTCSVHKCESDEFQCQSGQCVDDYESRTGVCNGHYDCKDKSDKSDETNCTTCSDEAIKCGSGECVHKLNLCNSIAECADGSDENEINCPHGSTPPVLTPIWRVGWQRYISTPNVSLQHLTEDIAVYFDSSVSPSVTWPFSPLSQAWKYAKETFQLETLSEPGSQFLYVVLGKRRYSYYNSLSFRSRSSGYRNVVDPGMRERNGWATQNSENFENLVFGLGNIVKIAMEGVENNADYKLCDSDVRNIVFYDIYMHLKGQGSADLVQYEANQFNRTLKLGQYNCFRDWFLPVYDKYGGATVLNNYFQIFKTNWLKKLGAYSEFTSYGDAQLNVGEFVHFWSGAAGEDLRYLAKSAFNSWDGVFMRQFAKAQTEFPNIKYPGELMSGKYQNNINSSYVDYE